MVTGKLQKKFCGLLKGGELWRIRENSEIRDIDPLTRGRCSKTYIIPPTKIVGSY